VTTRSFWHACRNHLCALIALLQLLADLHGVVRHLEWRRDPFLGELDCVIVACALSLVGFRSATRS